MARELELKSLLVAVLDEDDAEDRAKTKASWMARKMPGLHGVPVKVYKIVEAEGVTAPDGKRVFRVFVGPDGGTTVYQDKSYQSVMLNYGMQARVASEKYRRGETIN